MSQLFLTDLVIFRNWIFSLGITFCHENVIPYYSTANATFPSITICPDYYIAYKQEILTKFGITADDIRDRLKFPENLKEPETPGSFFQNVTFDLDETVAKIIFTTEKKPPNSNFSHFFYSSNNSNAVSRGESPKLKVLNKCCQSSDSWVNYFRCSWWCCQHCRYRRCCLCC